MTALPCCLAAVLSLAMRVCLRRRVAPTSSQGRGHKYDARGEAELAYGGNLGENRPVTSGSLFTISSENGSTCEYIMPVKHGRPRKYRSGRGWGKGEGTQCKPQRGRNLAILANLILYDTMLFSSLVQLKKQGA